MKNFNDLIKLNCMEPRTAYPYEELAIVISKCLNNPNLSVLPGLPSSVVASALSLSLSPSQKPFLKTSSRQSLLTVEDFNRAHKASASSLIRRSQSARLHRLGCASLKASHKPRCRGSCALGLVPPRRQDAGY